MINCNTCAKLIPDDSEFCPFCGNKVTRRVEERLVQVEPTVQIDVLIKRAFLALEEGAFEKADNYAEAVLNQDPENAQAYLAKLLIDLKVKTVEDLSKLENSFEDNVNYKRVMRYGDDNIKNTLKGYIDDINTRNENARIEGIYNKAIYMMTGIESENYKKALSLLKSISGWRDADTKIVICERKIRDIEAKEEAERVLLEVRAKRNKKIAIITTPIVCAIIAFVIVLVTVIILNNKYNDAIELMNAGKYSEAIIAFEELNGYKDSEAKIIECNTAILDGKYNSAIELMNAGQYSKAIIAFEALNGYKDSLSKISICEVAIINKHEKEYNLSEYVEVTINELWNNYSRYNGKKVKVIGYIGCIEFEEPTYSEYFYDAYLVKEKALVKEDTSEDIFGAYGYWEDTLKWKQQYIGFRIMQSTYFRQINLGTPLVNTGDKIVLYGVFTYNPSKIDEGNRYIADPHGYDLLVDNFLPFY